jgi:hypothetical protein
MIMYFMFIGIGYNIEFINDNIFNIFIVELMGFLILINLQNVNSKFNSFCNMLIFIIIGYFLSCHAKMHMVNSFINYISLMVLIYLVSKKLYKHTKYIYALSILFLELYVDLFFVNCILFNLIYRVIMFTILDYCSIK